MAGVTPAAAGEACDTLPRVANMISGARVVILDHRSIRGCAGLALGAPRPASGTAGLSPLADGDALHPLFFHFADGRSIPFGVFPADDVVAVWRGAAQHYGLPLIIAGDDGVMQEPLPQIGRLLVGPVRIRRRLGSLSGRRPRFLTRRKTSRLPCRPVVHHGREIAAGAL